MNHIIANRMFGSIIGGIVGDAYGSPYEFKQRGSYFPSKNMERNDNFNLPAGSFTDDSSLMLCLAASIIEKNSFDPVDQMKKYATWRQQGYMSVDPSKGCFDVGRTTSMAIARYLFATMQKERSINFVERGDCGKNKYYGLDGEQDNGNGGIMRLAPIPIYFWRDIDQVVHYSRLSSKVTHASTISLDCAAIMGWIIANLINGKTKEHISLPPKEIIDKQELKRLFAGGIYIKKNKHDISTSGYCVHSLEAAMWAFVNTTSFEEGMILLAEMGNDVDTICCIYGQIAGSYYGFDAIPKRWIDVLQRKELVMQISTRLVNLSLHNLHINKDYHSIKELEPYF